MAYTYKKKITITGQSGAGTDYQVLLSVGESSGSSGANFHLEGNSLKFPTTKNDGGDIKFFASDESTVLKFWVEGVSGTTPNRIAKIWVKVAADLGSNKDIYIYYGDSGASNLSNGDDTFIFFDDFEGTSIDTGKWNVDNSTGFSVSSSSLNGTDTTGRLRSKTNVGNGNEIITKYKRTSLNTNGYSVIGAYISDSNCFGLLDHPTTAYIRNDSNWIQQSKELANNVDLYASMKVYASTVYSVVYKYSDMSTDLGIGSLSNTISSEPITIGTRYDNGGTGQSYNAYWDFIFLKKNQATEPSYDSVGSQTFVIPPTSPTVTTSSVTNIATNSGLGNGNVTDDGGATITERGICWNTSPNPTTANSKSIATGTTGAFSADIHSLTTGTTYYVRAYATNSVGTSYGSEVTFSPSQVSLQQESGGFIKQENGRTFIF